MNITPGLGEIPREPPISPVEGRFAKGRFEVIKKDPTGTITTLVSLAVIGQSNKKQPEGEYAPLKIRVNEKVLNVKVNVDELSRITGKSPSEIRQSSSLEAMINEIAASTAGWELGIEKGVAPQAPALKGKIASASQQDLIRSQALVLRARSFEPAEDDEIMVDQYAEALANTWREKMLVSTNDPQRQKLIETTAPTLKKVIMQALTQELENGQALITLDNTFQVARKGEKIESIVIRMPIEELGSGSFANVHMIGLEIMRNQAVVETLIAEKSAKGPEDYSQMQPEEAQRKAKVAEEELINNHRMLNNAHDGVASGVNTDELITGLSITMAPHFPPNEIAGIQPKTRLVASGSQFVEWAEKAQHGDLEKFLADEFIHAPLDIDSTFQNWIMAVGRLTQLGIVNPDISPKNMLVYENEGNAVVKMADFGGAHYLGKPDLSGSFTAATTSVDDYETLSNANTPEKDFHFVELQGMIFSLGLLMDELISRTVLTASTETQLNKYDAMRHLIHDMRTTNPFKRPTVVEVMNRWETIQKACPDHIFSGALEKGALQPPAKNTVLYKMGLKARAHLRL